VGYDEMFAQRGEFPVEHAPQHDIVADPERAAGAAPFETDVERRHAFDAEDRFEGCDLRTVGIVRPLEPGARGAIGERECGPARQP